MHESSSNPRQPTVSPEPLARIPVDRPRKRTPAIGSVIGLVLARLRGRRSAAALIGTAVGGCILVLGSLQGVGVVTADQATQRALADLDAPQRLIGVVLSAQDASDGDASDAIARTAMNAVLPLTEPLVPMTVYRPPRDAIRVVTIDHVSRWVALVAGHIPIPCQARDPCEALRLSAEPLLNGTGEIGTSAIIGERTFEIVGVAQPVPGLPLDTTSAPGLVLVADGVDALRHDPALADVPRSGYWLAPLDPTRTHAWMLDDLSQRVDALRRDLPGGGRTFNVLAPDHTIEVVQARADVAVGRLIFISSLVIGVLLAFAVFAAAVERPDVGREYRRLRNQGAGRTELATFIGLEAAIPALIGSIVGALGAGLSVWTITALQGEPVGDVIRLALLQPGAVALTATVALLAALAVAAGIHPESGRFIQPRIIGTATLPVLVVLAWDRATRGPLEASDLASQGAGPGTVLLPGVLGLAVILGSLVVLPPLLRRLARTASRAPFALRIATISIARDPLRPAATLTLLAFSLGSAVLGVTYAQTLARGAADAAAFATGLDVRIQSYSPSGRFADEVVPRILSGDLGSDVEVRPIVRLEGQTATGRPFLLTGLDPAVLPELRRWRSDFSATTPTDIAASIAVPGPWILPGHALPAGIRDATLQVEYSGDPIALTVIMERPDGTFRYVDLGDLADGSQTLRKALFTTAELATMGPDEPAGWQVVGILAGNGGQTASGGSNPGGRQQGDLRVLGLPEIADPGRSIHLDVSGVTTRQMIRAQVRTDDLVLPALVSPELAADVDANGEVRVTLVSGLPLRIRPVATAVRFPTVTEQDVGLVVLDEGPLLLAMTARDPGTGTPNQVLLATPGDARTAEVVAKLSADPYPSLVISSRPGLEQAMANDPFAIGIVWGLGIGALAGLALSIAGVLMGASAELRDERGELRELEELGSRPSALRALVVLRAVILTLLGIMAGAVVGLGLGWLAAVTISVTGAGGQPVPPLVLVAPWLPILAMSLGLLGVVTAGVAVLARRHLATGSLPGQRR